jgi:hypothetical protein
MFGFQLCKLWLLRNNDYFSVTLDFIANFEFARTCPTNGNWSNDVTKGKGNITAIHKVKLSRYTPWRRLGGRRYSFYSFVTSALDGGEWLASRPGRALPPGKGPRSTHCTGDWVGPRAGLDAEARRKNPLSLSGIEPGRPVRNQTLYWLSYRGSSIYMGLQSAW